MKFVSVDEIKELLCGLDSLPWEDEVDNLVDNLTTIEMPRWIHVSEKLPENYRKVLTCDAKGNMHINWHFEGYEHPFCISEHDVRFYPVTHWMPLPDAPKNDDVWERKFLGKWIGLHEDN